MGCKKPPQRYKRKRTKEMTYLIIEKVDQFTTECIGTFEINLN